MKEIHTIIVPIDFHQHTDQLAEYAGYIGKQFGARLKFTHIIEPPQGIAPYEYPSFGAFRAEVSKHVEEEMTQFLNKYRKTYPDCEGKIFQGNIVDSIIKYANDEKADLIIIGTHGRKGFQKMWLGSVADRVIKNAPCPTLTCNPYKKTN